MLLSELQSLGSQLLSSRAHINNVPVLLNYMTETSAAEHCVESLLSLQAFFTPLVQDLPSKSVKKANHNNPDFIYKAWLRSMFHDFLQSLINITISPIPDPALREVALDTLMEFVKVSNRGKFHSAVYYKLLHAIVFSSLTVSDILLDVLPSKYFKYIDIRYFTYTSLEKLSQSLVYNSDDRTTNANSEKLPSESMDNSIRNLFHLLSSIPHLQAADSNADHEMWNALGIFVKKDIVIDGKGISKKKNKTQKTGDTSEKVLSAANVSKKIKQKFNKAWILFLGLTLPVDLYKEVLVSLPRDVIPHLSNPIMLCDFLTRSYDVGGVVSVMALHSLFILMTEHGLEYPNFYVKLYALLEPSIFMAKHRAKFFELLDSCLKSPLLPAYLAASFTKKLSRLALNVPPSGGLIIIALIHNLLRRHPSINCLVHQDHVETSEYDSERKEDSLAVATSANTRDRVGVDHFDNEQSDPRETKAMLSSLWEIDTLRHHYCPPVSSFVSSLENDLTVRAKTSEVAVKDFSSASYATIFNGEMRRRIKQVPMAFYSSTPTTLFSDAEFPGWTFNLKNECPVSLNEDKGATRGSEELDLSAKRKRVEH
ncbi:hypothetical protein Leryth_006637 [Lithospermum erythrorhizon]|nr:hypothetical protein Leryth_006637 [Lithospermum erythrorhizon]